MASKVLVPIADGSEPMEAAIIIAVLRGAGADVTVASVEKELRVDAGMGVKLVADALITDCSETIFDLIALPGGMPGSANLRDCEVLEKMVKKHAAEGRIYAAICAAPAVALGSWGLLNGRKATCYPPWKEKFSSKVTAVESRIEVDGQVVTARGAGPAMEFSLLLVEKLFGKEKANEGAGRLVMSPHPGEFINAKEFNPVNWALNKIPQILVPIANGSEEMEALLITDILRRANAKVVVASVEDTLEVLAFRKVKLVADMLIDEAVKLSHDLVILPGGPGGAEAFSKSEKLVNLLKRQSESNKPYGAICASPAFVLEPHGLLKGKKATAHPFFCSKLLDQSEVDTRVVIDGNLITSRAPGTAIEFSLAIAEKLFGREKALDLAKVLVL